MGIVGEPEKIGETKSAMANYARPRILTIRTGLIKLSDGAESYLLKTRPVLRNKYMPRSIEFYKRVVLSCFSRISASEVTERQINDLALFTIGHDELPNLTEVIQQMIAEGYLEYDAKKARYRILSYRPKAKKK